MLAPSGEGLILYQAYGNLYAMTGRKTHLLEDKQIPSVGVFDEVFCIWKAFGGNTSDLVIWRRNGQDYGPTPTLIKNFSTVAGDGVTNTTVCPIVNALAGRLLGAYDLGFATPRAVVHAGDKTSGEARSWYMISGDAKSWVCDCLHIFTVILHNCPTVEILAHRLGFLQTYELTNIIVDVFECHFQVKRMIVKVEMYDSRL
ncbi:hypothetical protein Tco_0410492 [Tanacetum coccineum]